MDIVCVLLAVVVFIVVCRWLSKFFGKLSAVCAEKESEERFYKEALLTAISDLRPVPEQEPEVHPVERLLQANQELIEKRQVHEAMERELDIKMH
jgi:hypothetical protein